MSFITLVAVSLPQQQQLLLLLFLKKGSAVRPSTFAEDLAKSEMPTATDYVQRTAFLKGEEVAQLVAKEVTALFAECNHTTTTLTHREREREHDRTECFNERRGRGRGREDEMRKREEHPQHETKKKKKDTLILKMKGALGRRKAKGTLILKRKIRASSL